MNQETRIKTLIGVTPERIDLDTNAAISNLEYNKGKGEQLIIEEIKFLSNDLKPNCYTIVIQYSIFIG